MANADLAAAFRVPKGLSVPVEYKHHRNGAVGTVTGAMANLIQSSQQLSKLPSMCPLSTLNEKTKKQK